MSLNQRFKILRKSLGLTQEVFGNQLNMQRSAYTQMERAKSNPTLEIIIDVINIHKVNPRWLLLGDGDMLDAPAKNNAQNLSINGDFNNASQVMTLQDCSEQLTDKNQKIEHLRDEVKKLQAQVDILKDVLNSK